METDNTFTDMPVAEAAASLAEFAIPAPTIDEDAIVPEPTPEDDEYVVRANDKAGFHAWMDALLSRPAPSALDNSCVGRWLPSDRLVELTQMKGKRFSSSGFTRGGSRMLFPEEALYLLDDGCLALLQPPKKRSWLTATAESSSRAASAAGAPLPSETASPALVSSGLGISSSGVYAVCDASPVSADTSSMEAATSLSHSSSSVAAAGENPADISSSSTREEAETRSSSSTTEAGNSSNSSGESGATTTAVSTTAADTAVVPTGDFDMATDATAAAAPVLPIATTTASESSTTAATTADAAADSSSSSAAGSAGSAPAVQPSTAEDSAGGAPVAQPSTAAERRKATRAAIKQPQQKQQQVAAPFLPNILPFQEAYELLLRHSDFAKFIAYGYLRNAGLVVLMHKPDPSGAIGNSTAAGSGAGDQPRRRLNPDFDVYARDGVTTFKLSSPGPPDFYVVLSK